MEFSEILGFLKILGKSIKVVVKNGKSIASITTVSLLLSSILILLFSYLYLSVLNYVTNSMNNSTPQFILFFALLVAVELCFIYAYIAITHASGVAATFATATSYTDTRLSLHDLFSIVKTKWRRPFIRNNVRGSCRNPMHFLLFVAAAVAILEVMSNPNPFTITIMSVVLVSFFVSQIYTSVAWTMSAVIPVVEDGCEAEEALDRAETLVQGQRIHGLMLNLILYLLSLIIFFSFWKIEDDKGSLNLMVYGLFFANFFSLTRVFMSVVYTVYYFQCIEYHRETIPQPGSFLHTALLAPNDIP